MKVLLLLLFLQFKGLIKGSKILNSVSGLVKCKKSEMNLNHTLLGGQTFRWKRTKIDRYVGVIGKQVWSLEQSENFIEYTVKELMTESKLKSMENSSNSIYDKTLSNYLRLDEDLRKLYRYWSSRDHKFKAVVNKFYGIRILRQDPVESLFSGILSANTLNSEKVALIEKLCYTFGERICDFEGNTYYEFPSLSTLADNSSQSSLRQLFGYKENYLHKTATLLIVYGGRDWLDDLKKSSYRKTMKDLLQLPGIGPKIADFICLTSLNHLEAIPITSRLFQVTKYNYMKDLALKKSLTKKVYKHIGHYYRQLYGEYAGWALTILFCSNYLNIQKQDPKIIRRPYKYNIRRRPINRKRMRKVTPRYYRSRKGFR